MKIKVNTNDNKNNKFLRQYSILKDIDRNLFLKTDEIKVSIFDFFKVKRLVKLAETGQDLTFEYGYRYWYKDKFLLKKGVFVPQPDTEGIIDLVNPELKIGLEIGVGSGVISSTLSIHFNKEMTAIDINPKALKLAYNNSKRVGAHINLLKRDIFEFKPNIKFDFIISNPPYIEYNDKDVEEWVKDNQPAEALYADEKGLKFYRHLIENAYDYLNKGGELYFEYGWTQKEYIESILKVNKYVKEYNFSKDLSGHWRFVKVVV